MITFTPVSIWDFKWSVVNSCHWQVLFIRHKLLHLNQSCVEFPVFFQVQLIEWVLNRETGFDPVPNVTFSTFSRDVAWSRTNNLLLTSPVSYQLIYNCLYGLFLHALCTCEFPGSASASKCTWDCALGYARLTKTEVMNKKEWTKYRVSLILSC